MIDARIVDCIESAGIDMVLSLPCNMLDGILQEIDTRGLKRIPVCREEEGVGIAAGAALAGKRPLLLMQNSGLGNSINALLSLTRLYRMPLFVLMSHRGGPGEQIEAQKPMGRAVPGILDTIEIPCRFMKTGGDLDALTSFIGSTFEGDAVQAAMLSRELWNEAQ